MPYATKKAVLNVACVVLPGVKMKKILYIVLDGLGDLPIPELNNKTPLEAASTPNMDGLAQRGQSGILYPVDKGIAPE